MGYTTDGSLEEGYTVYTKPDEPTIYIGKLYIEVESEVVAFDFIHATEEEKLIKYLEGTYPYTY